MRKTPAILFALLLLSAVPASAQQNSGDPCYGGNQKKTVAIAQTGNTKLVAGAGARRVYICSLLITASDAESLSVVEGTQTTNPCDTLPVAVVGAVTAANGMTLAANGSVSLGGGSSTVAASAIAANDVCLLQSGSGKVAGVVSFVQAP